jgi:hypothetical protein
MQNHKHARVFGFREPEGLYPNDLLDVMIRTKGKSFRMRPWLFPTKAGYIWYYGDNKIAYISYLSIDPIPLIFPSRADRMDKYFYEAILFDHVSLNLTQRYTKFFVRANSLLELSKGEPVEIRLVHPRYKLLDELTRLQYKETIGVKQ